MSVTRAEVEHITRLAALAVDEKSLPALTEQIRQILEYVSQLASVEDPPDLATGAYPGPRQPLRDDVPRPGPLGFSLGDMAPAFHDGLFLVPRLGGVGSGAPEPNEGDDH